MNKIEWLKRQRERINISQSDLVRALRDAGFEVSQSSVSHWETGKFNLPLEDVRFRRALANALQMTIPELLTMAGYEINPSYSAQAMRGADIIDQLPPERRELAVSVLEQFLRAPTG